MNFSPPIIFQLQKGNKKGVVLLASVIVLAGIILVLIVGAFLALNTIRWYSFSLPLSAQAFNNAESCLAIVLSKLKTNPAFNTQGNWEKFEGGNIKCEYFVENQGEKKIVKTKGEFAGYFKKILVELEK